MGKRKKTREFTDEERGMMVGLHVAGWTYEKIGDYMDCGTTTVYDNIVKKEEFGTVKNRPRSGRPRATTPNQDKHIRIATLMNRFRPSCEIARNIISEKTSKQLNRRTVSRRQVEAGLPGRIARTKPKLTKKQKRARVAWAKKYRHWTHSDWEKVLWSDESPFTLFVKGGKVWVRRREWEQYASCCMHPSVKFGGGHINVWGCFSSQGVGDLHQIHGNMNGAMYREILKNHMSPHLRQLGADFKFQHDNDPKHTSKVVKRYLSNAGFTVLAWPSQSPDLNPIENLWGHIKHRLRKLTVAPSSLPEVYEYVKLQWESLEREYLLNLIHSMPSRIELVLENKGGATKY
jgi:transposase